MPTLQELEQGAQLEVPRDVGHAIKALAADNNHRVAWRFIVDHLCGRTRLSFVPGLPEARDMMLWREGRRFVGEWLERIVETPIPPIEEVESPTRLLAEKQRRRET